MEGAGCADCSEAEALAAALIAAEWKAALATRTPAATARNNNVRAFFIKLPPSIP